MSSTRVYGRATEADVPSLVRLVHHAFASTPDCEEEWIRPSGVDNFRGVREYEHGALSSCLLRIPMGQYFGGKRVSMVGIAAVAVNPEHRGHGAARWMMGKAMQEAQEEGTALSCLYASTQGLYRHVGYEQAGYHCFSRLLPHRIDVRAREPQVRPLTTHDEEALGACYTKFAQQYSGMLDRTFYIWRRIREMRGKKYHGFGIENPAGGLDGYVFLAQNRVSDGIEIEVSDLVFLNPRAGQRLLGFLADFSTTTKDITLTGGPLHPVLSLMTSHHYTISKSEIWMLRITDLAAALTERGYHKGVTVTVQINVHDPVVRANDGSWTLHVEHGRGEVKREAAMRPAITCTINGLAAVYSGMYTARQAAGLGWIEGDAGAMDAIDAAFGGFGVPWMTDFF